MPDIKKETNVDVVKQLSAFKQTKLPEINDSISKQKSKAAILLSSIKAKRAELLELEEQKRKLEEAKLQAEKTAEEAQKQPKEKPEKAVSEEKVEEEKSHEEAKPVEAVKVEPAPQEKPVEKPVPEKKRKVEKVAKPADSDFVRETQEVLPNGEMRRIYVPPTPEKKPKVQTRVFGQNGYQAPRNNKPQGDFKAGAGQQKPGLKKPTATLENMPQQFPPKPGQQKGKGGKPGGAVGGKNYDDRSNKMNKRDLMKKGYIVDDRVSYDEDGEEIVRSYKAPKNRGGGNSATVVIEHAVITTDPVPIKTLSEKIGKSAAEIVKTLFVLGIMKTINDSISRRPSGLRKTIN